MKTLAFFWMCLAMVLSLQGWGQDRNALRLHVRELHDLEDHKKIISLLDSVSENQVLSAEFSFYKGRALFNSGRFSEARSVLRPIENDSVLAPRVKQMLANIAVQQKNNTEALSYLLNLGTLFPDNPVYHQRIARIFFSEGNYPAAMNYMLTAYRRDTLNQTSIAELADIWMKMEMPGNAFRLLSNGIELYPENFLFRRQMVSVCHRQRKMPETVEHAAFLTERGDTTPTVVRLKAFAYYELGELDKADFWLDYLLNNELISEDIFFYKGKVAQARGNAREAAGYYEEAVKMTLSPNFNPFILQLAITLHENKQYQESIRWLQTARQFSDRPELIYYLARNFDLFYQDKQPALQHYQMFIGRADDQLEEQREYARQRVRELREILHLQGE
jgi:predicted Zn-dependent protease